MSSHIVRDIKAAAYSRHETVANAMHMVGYRWRRPRHKPTNIDQMLVGVPKSNLIRILNVITTHGSYGHGPF